MKELKKYIALFSIVVVFAILITNYDFSRGLNDNLNRLGQDKYYVQITTDGIEKTYDGNTSKYFEYKLTGFDKDSKEKELKFNAQKNLRKEAFLRVYYSDKEGEGVSAWEEVKKDELPAKVKEKLAVK
ncbi:YxeA family protein [Bacillus pseudomycoides]|uniref:YxeA family protein n=1 Tax=Bacillus pseudomycoides TaxID=64104 RepID=UPI00115567A0|nr:YxeA family protein [Bacillus pseudomycoides]